LSNSDKRNLEEAKGKKKAEIDYDNMDAKKIPIDDESDNDFEEANVDKIISWNKKGPNGEKEVHLRIAWEKPCSQPITWESVDTFCDNPGLDVVKKL